MCIIPSICLFIVDGIYCILVKISVSLSLALFLEFGSFEGIRQNQSFEFDVVTINTHECRILLISIVYALCRERSINEIFATWRQFLLRVECHLCH
uniref:Uncharacterized protein n=1 Tax=Rhizophora mucronata TaxID=61149 RepID=A0A2P2K052_RHIMU